MLRYLVVLLALPLVDFFLLAELASVIGVWKTLAIVVLTGLIGAEFVRREARFVLEKLGASVTAEEVSRNFLEALILVFAGLMLISPGLITDLLGAVVAVRPVRERLVARLAERMKEKASFEIELVRL